MASDRGVALTPTTLAQKGKEAIVAGTYTVDPGHSGVGVEIERLGISRVQGRFSKISGLIVLDPKRWERSSMTLRVEPKLVDTGVAARDALLGTKAFFDVATYPDILFVSKHLWKSRKEYIAEGDLTIRGVTKEVRVLFNMAGVDGRVGIVSKPLRIDRRDYGLPYDVKLPDGTPVIGYDVDVRISIEAVR